MLVLVGAAFGTGCAAGPAPVDHYYRIEVAEPSASASKPLTGTLHVDRLRTDALGGERHVLHRVDGSSPEIRKHAYHRWSDPPAVALQTELVTYLQHAGAAEVVMTANARVRPDWIVSGRLNHFERWTGSQAQVVVEMDLDVTDAAGEIVFRKTYKETRTASATDVAQAVAGLNDAVHGIFERFLSDLRAAV
jgi:ABC-type uncharacterized transport system auxiliary subunit